MQRQVSGYRLGALRYEIDGFGFYDAMEAESGAPYLVKGFQQDFSPLASLERLENERLVLLERALSPSCALYPIKRIDSNQNTYLLLDHFAGAPLTDLVGRIPLTALYDLATELLRAIAECHAHDVWHLALSPQAVLWHEPVREMRLTHFIQARRASNDRQPADETVLSAYSAPEQTGQLSVSVGPSTDLYAAGAVLYALLAGQPPFAASSDRTDLSHRLVSQAAVPLVDRINGIPPRLSELVSAMLAKSPGDRPSALNALEELRELRQWSGTKPRSRRAPVTGRPRLRGREAELSALRDAARAAASGAARTLHLMGPPGSGKSRLVEEFSVELSDLHWLTACGKFEQFRRQQPYSALIAAVSGMLDHLLGHSTSLLEEWRERLSRIEPAFKAVLAEQFTPLSVFIGPQPSPPRLGPAETQNRFHEAFRALLDVLAEPGHPLLLVLDDLQWSDAATIELLAELFLKPGRKHLLLILAYRPKEVEAGSRVAKFLHEHSSDRTTPAAPTIELGSLSSGAISALCSDLVFPCSTALELSGLVESGCHGNPLFAMEIVKRLHRTRALEWVETEGTATWRLNGSIAPAQTPSEGVVDFIVSRMDALPEACRELLIAASVVGHTFSLRDVQRASQLEHTALTSALRRAQSEALIVPASRAAEAWLDGASSASTKELEFAFFHDRVQQAAHSLCSKEARAQLHLALGRSLQSDAEGRRETLFAAVEHLNHVHELLSAAERAQLAEMNVMAARMARESIAYRTAAELLNNALSLRVDGDISNRKMRFEASLLLAENLYLSTEFEAAEAAFADALETARELDEQVEVQRTRLVLYLHMQRYGDAINLGLAALALLGVRLPVRPSPARLAASLASTLIAMRGKSAAELLNRPDTANPRERLVLDLLVLEWTPSFWTNQQLNALVVLKLIDMTAALGNTPQAPMAYVCFGILNHVLLKRHRHGLQFSQLAVKLLDRSAQSFIASRVRFLALTFFGALERENVANVSAYEELLGKCLESGEHVFAGHTIDGITTSLPVHGFRIPEVERRLEACEAIAARIGSPSSTELIGIIRAFCRALREGPHSGTQPLGSLEIRFESYVGVHGMLEMVVSYLWGDDDGVLRLAAKLQRNQVIQSNPLHASLFTLFRVLSLCRRRQRRSLLLVRRLVARIGNFEAIFPANFRSMLRLCQAEQALLSGDQHSAINRYHQAIGEAAASGHDLVHAIACERLAAVHEARMERAGFEEYIRIASYSYRRFGASAKARHLELAHPGVDLREREPQELGSIASGMVDLRPEAVMRAAYAIAEETRSERVAESLLRVIAAAAGAQRAFLIKESNDEWQVIAGWEGDRPGHRALRILSLGCVSESVVRYAARSKTPVQLSDTAEDARFKQDHYLRERKPRSVLCLPLLHRGDLAAVLYLENSVCSHVFTAEQRKLAIMLGQQAAITLAVADYHKIQIAALQAKINPHFLHNSLSVIAELVTSDPAKAENAILKLSKLYRYVLNASADHIVSLDQEIAITRDYLAIEQFRCGERLNIELDVRGAPNDVQVPALILQPLVENAVRHGVGRKVGPGTVRVEVEVEADSCRLLVQDDGPGWRVGTPAGGFGLRSVRERLNLLYRGTSELRIQKGEGVTVEMRIPLRPYDSSDVRAAGTGDN